MPSRRGSASDFNPRSSCEERPDISKYDKETQDISIHAPHARSDFTYRQV